jgi:hypothetical protein
MMDLLAGMGNTPYYQGTNSAAETYSCFQKTSFIDMLLSLQSLISVSAAAKIGIVYMVHGGFEH